MTVISTFGEPTVVSVVRDRIAPRDRRSTGSACRLILRMSDAGLAWLALLPAAPLIGIVALAIKLSDRGPVFSRCRRVARDGSSFNALRFRTTKDRPQNARGTMCWDVPLSGVGQVLCRTRVAALPQLVNVLRGEMTLIGTGTELERPDFLRSAEHHA